ncbi:MAG: DUF3089 domain-containing protein [Gammaproteobacteria bacterium]|nr:DUF3089 domain-containing protein [Gammaproteobacteria bacterium]
MLLLKFYFRETTTIMNIKHPQSKLPILALLAVAGLALAASVSAQTVPVDYANADSWLCRGADSDLGACHVDLTATIVAADGRLTTEMFTPFTDAPIDCFYVYPTVSLDATANSDLLAGPEEYNVVLQQFARFGAHCPTFAPMYRQSTLSALRGGIAGADRTLGYNDVLSAWNYYLANYNNVRGVVLVRHSQGSGVLIQLIAAEIDGKPVQEKIISAMLLGTTVRVPAGQVVGGAFKQMPLCTSARDIQCIIVYATFRDTIEPTANALFGRNGRDSVAACTNPAWLATGSNEADAYLSAVQEGRTAVAAWTSAQPKLDTPFAKAPGLLSVDCVSSGTHHYLELSVHANAADPRTDDIAGDILTAEGTPDAGWGLHLLDANVGMGDLLSILDKQAVVYLGKQ